MWRFQQSLAVHYSRNPKLDKHETKFEPRKSRIREGMGETGIEIVSVAGKEPRFLIATATGAVVGDLSLSRSRFKSRFLSSRFHSISLGRVLVLSELFQAGEGF